MWYKSRIEWGYSQVDNLDAFAYHARHNFPMVMLHKLFANPQHVALAALLAAGCTISILICWSALHTNGAFGFPLDDPWIHLQFARNLHEFGSFSYFRNEMATSGSTSPLYTVLLAAGFFVTTNEMVLSYTLGIAFFIAGAFMLSRIAGKAFNAQAILGIGCVALFLLEPRLEWAALSGMETTLFIVMLLVVWYFYAHRSARMLGLSAGLLLWTRPEALIFLAVLGIDLAYHAWWLRRTPLKKKHQTPERPDLRWVYPALAIAAAIGGIYFGFNYALSGSFLPNTYAAKTRYYSSNGTGFPLAVFHFLTDGHMPVLAFAATIAVFEVAWKCVKRTHQEYLIPVLWSAGLFFAYWQKLPFLYQEGRYLMPVLPFVILLGMRGIELAIIGGKKTLALLRPKGADVGFAAGASVLLAAQFAYGTWSMHAEYSEQCKYITERQVRTAVWIRMNTPPDAVIGTHDVGAIGYYSGRRIVDMVGLVSPGMIDNIGSFDRLRTFLIRNHVTHLAVLRNWFEVINQNPLFMTDERKPEIMEVFRFDPSRTHFTPQNAALMTGQARYLLSVGQVERAGPMLEQSLRIDPQSARTHCAMGLALLAAGREAEAEREIRTALSLQPDSKEAVEALERLAAQKKDKP
jgi:tetratricopeptide (TPR) repeat protein